MIEVENDGYIDGRKLWKAVESKTAYFTTWAKRAIEYAGLEVKKDYILEKDQTNKPGRRQENYKFTLRAARLIAMLEKSAAGAKVRDYLVNLLEQRESLKLLTVKESVFAHKVVNAMRYIESQQAAYSAHQQSYILENQNPYVFADFAKYRSKIIGWDKESVEKALDKYLAIHYHPKGKRLQKRSMSVKLSIMDTSEAIRVAVLDILYAKGERGATAQNFARICKEIAAEMEITPKAKNEADLFEHKQNVETVARLIEKD